MLRWESLLGQVKTCHFILKATGIFCRIFTHGCKIEASGMIFRKITFGFVQRAGVEGRMGQNRASSYDDYRCPGEAGLSMNQDRGSENGGKRWAPKDYKGG